MLNLAGNFNQFRPEAQVLAEYVRGGQAQPIGLTALLEQKVEEVNQHLEWRKKVMEMETYYDRVVRNTAYEARMEGIEIGRSESERREKEMILGMLRENIPETAILNISHLTKEELEEIKKTGM